MFWLAPAVVIQYLGVCSPAPRLSGRCRPASRSGTTSEGWCGCSGPLWRCWRGRGRASLHPGSLRIPAAREDYEGFKTLSVSLILLILAFNTTRENGRFLTEMLIKWPKKSKVLTHRLFCPIHTRLPDQGVVTELHLVGVNHVPTVCEQDTCRLITHVRHWWILKTSVLRLANVL